MTPVLAYSAPVSPQPTFSSPQREIDITQRLILSTMHQVRSDKRTSSAMEWNATFQPNRRAYLHSIADAADRRITRGQAILAMFADRVRAGDFPAVDDFEFDRVMA